jgi:hypothetical protein
MNPKEKTIHPKIRNEFKIPYREYYYMCFEGSYVPEFVEFAIKDYEKQIQEQIGLFVKWARKENILITKKGIISELNSLRRNQKTLKGDEE